MIVSPPNASGGVLPVFDPVVFGQVTDLLGLVRVMPHLHRLQSDAIAAFQGSIETPGVIDLWRREAHALHTQAALIGFSRFSAACARLEVACTTGQDLECELVATRLLSVGVVEKLIAMVGPGTP